jgi:signal transduction protein with GAF and PtsI domain
MQELFVELDWDVIESLTHEERVKMVKEQAKAKFAGIGDIYVEDRWLDSGDMENRFEKGM